MTLADLALEEMALESARHEADHIYAVAEAVTYRQALLIALEGWAADKRAWAAAQRRLAGAEQRLRQLMGTEPWHPDDGPTRG